MTVTIQAERRLSVSEASLVICRAWRGAQSCSTKPWNPCVRRRGTNFNGLSREALALESRSEIFAALPVARSGDAGQASPPRGGYSLAAALTPVSSVWGSVWRGGCRRGLAAQGKPMSRYVLLHGF